MGKNVIPFRRRKGVTDSEEVANRGLQIIVRVRRRRYAGDMSCAATTLVAEADPLRIARLEFYKWKAKWETKFLRLRQPARVGDRIEGWRVCWLGGWDKGRLFYVVMVERVVHGPNHLPLD